MLSTSYQYIFIHILCMTEHSYYGTGPFKMFAGYSGCALIRLSDQLICEGKWQGTLNQKNHFTSHWEKLYFGTAHTIIACSSLLNFISMFASLSCTLLRARFILLRYFSWQHNMRRGAHSLRRFDSSFHSWYMFSQLFRIKRTGKLNRKIQWTKIVNVRAFGRATNEKKKMWKHLM